MPSKPPPIPEHLIAILAELGQAVREQRKRLKLSATTTAEAAGLSRMTLHRMERGEPAVTLGAYLAVLDALGLQLRVHDPKRAAADEALPLQLRLADYPQLRRLAWQMPAQALVSPAEALNLYERNWRHVDPEALQPHERALVQRLSQTLGGGRLLV